MDCRIRDLTMWGKWGIQSLMKIETSYPLPSPRNSWPFKNMNIGDSVFLGGRTSDGAAVKAAQNYGRANGKKFASRNVDGGVRVWRTA